MGRTRILQVGPPAASMAVKFIGTGTDLGRVNKKDSFTNLVLACAHNCTSHPPQVLGVR